MLITHLGQGKKHSFYFPLELSKLISFFLPPSLVFIIRSVMSHKKGIVFEMRIVCCSERVEKYRFIAVLRSSMEQVQVDLQLVFAKELLEALHQACRSIGQRGCFVDSFDFDLPSRETRQRERERERACPILDRSID